MSFDRDTMWARKVSGKREIRIEGVGPTKHNAQYVLSFQDADQLCREVGRILIKYRDCQEAKR